MNEKMKKATNQDTLKALRIAEIKATDKEDFNNCVSDLVKTASLDTDEAKIIANAIRSKFLPNILREAGFEDDEIKDHVNLDSEAEQTADFANDFSNDIRLTPAMPCPLRSLAFQWVCHTLINPAQIKPRNRGGCNPSATTNRG